MGSRSSKGSRNEPSQAPVTSKPKDPLKVVGSKQNIKLTLLNKVIMGVFTFYTYLYIRESKCVESLWHEYLFKAEMVPVYCIKD